MITIKKVVINNYLSFGEGVELDLTRAAVTQLIGENGAGKSSIHLVIEELLYNKNSKKISKKNLKNRYSDAAYYGGIIEFSDGVSEYKLTKEVKATTKVVLERNGENISGHTATQTYSVLADILGMDFATFSKFVNQSLVSSLDFLALTDAKKKEFLVSFLGLEKYVQVGKKAKDEETKLKGLLPTLETKVSRAKDKVENLEKRIELLSAEDIPAVVENLQPPKDDFSSIEKEIQILELTYSKELAQYQSQEQDRDASSLVIKDTDSSIPRIEKKLELLKNNIKELDQYLETTQPKLSSKLQKLADAKAEIGASERGFTKARKDMQDLKASIKTDCYACGRPLDVDDKLAMLDSLAAKSMAAESEYNSKRVELNQIIDSLNAEVTKLNNHVQEARDAHNADSRKLSALEQELINLSKDRDKANETLDFIKNNEYPEPRKPDVTALRAEAKDKADNFERYLEEYNQNVRNKEKAIARDASIKTAREQLVLNQALLEEDEAEVALLTSSKTMYSIIKDALSSKGIINNKIALLMKEVSTYINTYLERLSSSRYSIEFSVSESKLVILVYYRGVPVEIGTLSSGEYAIVQVATLLGIRKALFNLTRNRTNLMFLDEVISVLDDKVKPILLEILSEEVNMNCFIVSHSYRHPFARALYVTKKNNISSISEG